MRIYLLLTGFLCLVVSCQHASDKKNEATADSTNNFKNISSTAAKENNLPNRKFIRTADIKFKVNDVTKTTYNIENICSNHGGFVTFTNIESNIDEHSETAISMDSLLETTYYTITNNITIRVPNTKLDTTLKDIAKNIDYLDYRIIKAEDVSLQLLSNNLIQIRNTKNNNRLSNDIDKNTKVLHETTFAEETILSQQEKIDDANLAKLSLNDQIKFSTVNLLIYQRQGINRNIVFNEKIIDKYQIGLGYKLLEGLIYGWKILVFLIVFLSKLWGVALIAALIWAAYKRLSKKKKK